MGSTLKMTRRNDYLLQLHTESEIVFVDNFRTITSYAMDNLMRFRCFIKCFILIKKYS